jgi:hypothetical protein
MNNEAAEKVTAPDDFKELVRYTAAGYGGGLFLGLILDHFGLQFSPVGQWAVRTLSGEGESLFEGVFAVRRRLGRRRGSMAEAYGWGKLLGMIAPWIIDWGSRFLGVNPYNVGSFYIPFFYAQSDQIGANISGLVYLKRSEKSWRLTLARYFRHPVMLSSLGIIFVVPIGLVTARLAGFSPSTQVKTAVETIAANICWIPPLVGWLNERSRERKGRGS